MPVQCAGTVGACVSCVSASTREQRCQARRLYIMKKSFLL